MVVGDKCLGMLEAVGEVFPVAKYQMCSQSHLAPKLRCTRRSTPRRARELTEKRLRRWRSSCAPWSRRTRVAGSFPDGDSALMPVCARLRHVAGTQWGNKKNMNMKHLEAALEDASIAGRLHSRQSLQTNLRKTIDATESSLLPAWS